MKYSVIQLSDFHFASSYGYPAPGRVSGWEAHDASLCEALPTAIENACHIAGVEPTSAIYAFVGDLTRSGTETQFSVAASYLHSRVERTLLAVGGGLQLSRERTVVVSGNHDHWSGILPKFPRHAYDPNLTHAQFLPTPWWLPLPDARAPQRIELFGLDSNSGFMRQRMVTIEQEGAFDDQEFARFCDLMRASLEAQKHSDQVVRLVLSHHHLHSPPGDPKLPLPLVKPDQDRLLIAASRADAILTGHKHVVNIHPHLVALPNSPTLYEFRSPSAVQALEAMTNDGTRQRGFWLHVFDFQRDAIIRRSWLTWWDPTRRAFDVDRSPYDWKWK